MTNKIIWKSFQNGILQESFISLPIIEQTNPFFILIEEDLRNNKYQLVFFIQPIC
jgi:hypothetical protein